MREKDTPVFLVETKSDPVLIRVRGRASYLNCSSLKPFFSHCIDEGKRHFVLDLHECTGADSTFWGLLVGIALNLKKTQPQGSLCLQHLVGTNKESVIYLGLHHVLKIDDPDKHTESTSQATALTQEMASALLILEAHKDLITAEPQNAQQFQEVISFIREQEMKDQ